MLFRSKLEEHYGFDPELSPWISVKEGVGKMTFDSELAANSWIALWNRWNLATKAGPMSFVAKHLDTSPWRCQSKIPCRNLAAGEDKLAFAQEQIVRLCKWSKVPGHFTRPDFLKAKKSNDGKSHFLSWIPDEAMLATQIGRAHV